MSDKWTWRPLGELFGIGAGKTMSAAARAGEDKVPFLRTSNVLWDQIDLTNLDEMAIPRQELAEKRLEPGDLLVCEGGEIGRAAIWDGTIETITFQNHLHRLRPKVDEVVPRFYVYFLQSAFTQLGIFEGAGNRTTIPNLSSSRLAALKVPHPPLHEQLAIVHLLSQARRAAQLHDAQLRLALELKHAAMRELFAQGLRGEEKKETKVGQVPESWAVVPLGSLGKIGNGSTPRKSVATYWNGGSFPWLTSAKVYDRDIYAAEQFVTDTALVECHLPRVHPGAILMAITGQGKTLGHVAVLRTEATINQHIAYLQTDVEQVEPDFIRGYLETQYDNLRQVASGGGSTKGALTCAFLKGLPVPLPHMEEQREIVAVLKALDRKIALHLKKRTVLEELFTSLLHKVMTGEISSGDLVLPANISATEGGAS